MRLATTIRAAWPWHFSCKHCSVPRGTAHSHHRQIVSSPSQYQCQTKNCNAVTGTLWRQFLKCACCGCSHIPNSLPLSAADHIIFTALPKFVQLSFMDDPQWLVHTANTDKTRLPCLVLSVVWTEFTTVFNIMETEQFCPEPLTLNPNPNRKKLQNWKATE